MRYVLHSVQLLLKSAAQYRASFLMQTLAQLVMTGGEVRVRGGRLTGIDLAALRAELTNRMKPFMASAAQYADII